MFCPDRCAAGKASPKRARYLRSRSASFLVARFSRLLECQAADRINEISLGLFCVDPATPGNVEAWFDDVLVTLP